MGRYYAQVILAPSSGDSKDVMINGFAAGQIGELDLTYATAWKDVLKAFYDDVKASGGLRSVAQSGHVVKFYDIEGSPPNYPKFEENFALATTATALDLPREVSLCVSYSNLQAVTVARARRRGRIYLSGWSASSNSAGRPTVGAAEGLFDAYVDYVEAFNGLGSLVASIWSRTEEVTFPVERVWVDNEWDTMRSRGGESTFRYDWTAP